MKVIQLTRGLTTVVDDEDFDALAQYRWHATSKGYANRTVWDKATKKRNQLPMQVAIMGQKEGFMVDHKNGDHRDNRRENLRFATKSQNNQNRKIRIDNTTGFSGVAPHHGGFRARIWVGEKRVHLGTFDTAEEAKKAYDEAAISVFGEFARKN